MSIDISVAKNFTETPGGRFRHDGKWSGEEFRDEILLPAFREAKSKKEKLRILLDGTAGYATSFLEEAFGGLVRILGVRISVGIEIVSANSSRKREVESYIEDAERKLA